jgi:probable rRNA maturation factor
MSGRTNRIYIRNDQKKVKIPRGMRDIVRKCCNAVLKDEGMNEACEVSVTFVDNEQIKRLNGEFRNKPVETDVLSFPMGEDGVYDTDPETGAKLLGDVVISMEKALEQSVEYNHSIQREVGFLTVHSMYHLLGYDHETGEEDARLMHSKEKKTLDRIGLTRDAYSEEK